MWAELSGDGMLYNTAHFDVKRKIGVTPKIPTDVGSSKSIAKAYFSTLTGTYEERQKQAVARYGWKVGDRVKIVSDFSRDEDGSECSAPSRNKWKADMIGKVYPIKSIHNNAIVLSTNKSSEHPRFPYFALEPA